MSSLLSLPGTSSRSRDGYHSLSEPVKTHTVSAGGIPQSIELGDLGNSSFYDKVALLRESIRSYDTQLSCLETKQLYSLQPQHDQSTLETISVELNEVETLLSLSGQSLRKKLEELGYEVGNDEAKRGHWDNLKSTFKRAVERQQSLEMAQRERVRERVARQYRIGNLIRRFRQRRETVKPEATEEEIKEVLSTSSAPQIFQQALSGSQRTSAALSALNEAKNRQTELSQIESSLVELSQLIQQVADLVVEQDPQIVKVEETSAEVEKDLENGLKEVQKARLSATAARHKRKICAAIAIIMVTIVIVVVVVQFKGSGGGGAGSKPGETEPKEETTPVDISALIPGQL
ncbi:hypothetical protein JCM16303_000588 [Sporobolomyces ruberrimus]